MMLLGRASAIVKGQPACPLVLVPCGYGAQASSTAKLPRSVVSSQRHAAGLQFAAEKLRSCRNVALSSSLIPLISALPSTADPPRPKFGLHVAVITSRHQKLCSGMTAGTTAGMRQDHLQLSRVRHRGSMMAKSSSMASVSWEEAESVAAAPASAAATTTGGAGVVSDSSPSYRLPPPEITSIVDAPPNPAISFSPRRDSLLFLHRPSMPSIAELAREELKLAGIRIDPQANTRSRLSSYLGISIFSLTEQDTLEDERHVVGLPEGAKINFVSWSPSASHIAFAVHHADQNDDDASRRSRLLSLWVADVASGEARQVADLSQLALNTVFDSYSWLDDTSLVVCSIPSSRPPPPRRPSVPKGPKVQDNQAASRAQARTFTDLLNDKHDEDLFEFFGTSQLLLVSLDGSGITPIGEPGIFTSVDPSHDSSFLLVKKMKRPFSLELPCGRFPLEVQLWDLRGLRGPEGGAAGGANEGPISPPSVTVADLPLATSIPIAFNSVREGKRGIFWRADREAELYWVEAQDGGDASREASPRDIIFSQPAAALFPPANEEQQAAGSEGQKEEVIFGLDLRYGGVSWTDGSSCLVDESWYKTRRTRTWQVPLVSSSSQQQAMPNSHGGTREGGGAGGAEGAAAESEGGEPAAASAAARLVFDRSYEDRYSDPGSPLARRTSLGTYVVAEFEVEGRGSRLILSGDGATPEGNVPFLDLFDIATGAVERIWQSDSNEFLENVSSLLTDTKDGPIKLEESKFLLNRESKLEPPQYFIKRWRDGSEVQLTHFPHPYPSLKHVSKELIRYQRKDGVQLTAQLYLPAGYDKDRDGPLPTIMWAYPREFKSKDAAGQVRGSPNQFPSIGGTSPLLWLARGYAVLSGPSMPIIGEGDEEANDRFVEQLVASAEAAVEEVTRRGVSDRHRIAIGGHSYGAFMAANLLARAPDLFCCAIAQSGAYNRTLTPFGFQSEERTLWQVPDVYMAMSPFALADKVKAPILLVHGQDDNNAGTFPLQSERFYGALKGHGVPCRLVLLPHEGHGYRARESVLHVLAETSDWLDTYCKNRLSPQTKSSL